MTREQAMEKAREIMRYFPTQQGVAEAATIILEAVAAERERCLAIVADTDGDDFPQEEIESRIRQGGEP